MCATHLLIMLYLSVKFLIKFALVVYEISLRQDFDLRPDCDVDLGRRNLNQVRDTHSHYALFFCEVPSNLLY